MCNRLAKFQIVGIWTRCSTMFQWERVRVWEAPYAFSFKIIVVILQDRSYLKCANVVGSKDPAAISVGASASALFVF